MNRKALKRVVIWFFFGFILTAIPIVAAAAMSLPTNASLSDFFESVFNQDLLAVAFTLSAAAGADVLSSRDNRDSDLFKLALGGLTMILAIIAAISFAAIKAGNYHFSPGQLEDGIIFLYSGSMFCSMLCEVLSEV